MNLTRLAISGADSDVDPRDLLKLSEEFPFVEWAILVARDEFGTSRYPSREWFAECHKAIEETKSEAMFAVHLCNTWPEELARGVPSDAFASLADILSGFPRLRIQLNFVRQIVDRSLDPHKLLPALPREYEYMFQVPSFEDAELVLAARRAGLNASLFFDISAGTGITPENWPAPPRISAEERASHQSTRWWVGFAGGLGPHNLEHTLERLETLAPDGEFWCDMETKVRTNGTLDLAKVRAVLEIAQRFIKKGENNVAAKVSQEKNVPHENGI